MNALVSCRFSLLALSMVAIAACAAPMDASSEGDDATSAAPTSFKASIPGFTVWVDDVVEPTQMGTAAAWVLRGKTSKNLTSVESFSQAGDLYGEAHVDSARVFSITLDGPTMQSLLEETPLLLELDVAGAAKPVFAELTFAPRLEHFSGSTKLYALETITPVLVGGAVRFRGALSVASGVTGVAVNAAGAQESVAATSTHGFAFDMTPSAFMSAVRGPSPVFEIDAAYQGAPIQKLASMELRLTGLHLSADEPGVAFPVPACDPAVTACLTALPATQPDTGACGSVGEVDACNQE